jgi:hypothetical protein
MLFGLSTALARSVVVAQLIGQLGERAAEERTNKKEKKGSEKVVQDISYVRTKNRAESYIFFIVRPESHVTICLFRLAKN